MKTYEQDTPRHDIELAEVQEQIKEYLKNVLPDDIYDLWIDNFEFEYIGLDKVIVGYYGTQSLRKFNKRYKKMVWQNICFVIGRSKKFVIHKRRVKSSSARIVKSNKVKKNIKVAKLFAISIVFVGIALVFAVMMCSYVGNRSFTETFYNASSLKIDNKIRVVLISDLHSCTFGKDNTKLTERVDKLGPDVIICTGDIIDSDVDKTDSILNMCDYLADVAPTYYIYGNNEIETIYDFAFNKNDIDKKLGFNDSNRDADKLLELKDDLESKLESRGVKVLKNEKDTIKIGTTNVDVYGVLTSNPSAFWTYTYESFDEYLQAEPDNFKITAIHEPIIFEESDMDFYGDLMVCGHTHGGTIRVPILGPLYTHEGGLFPERNGCYIYGRYDVAGRPLVVSSGLENNNLLRINNPPELVIIDVNKF